MNVKLKKNPRCLITCQKEKNLKIEIQTLVFTCSGQF